MSFCHQFFQYEGIMAEHIDMPISVVPQASMRSTQRRVHVVTLSPNFARNLFQPSPTVKRSFAGREIYMPQSIKRGSGHANYRNREAVTLALKGRYCSATGQTDRDTDESET